MSTNITDEELEAFTRLQESDPVEGVRALRQLRADRDRVRAANLQKTFEAFSAEHADVLDDPWLNEKVQQVEQLLLRNGPPLDDPTRWERAVAIVRRKYGNADSRAIAEMRRARSVGARQLPDDERDGGISAEQLQEDEHERFAHEGVVEIHGHRHGRLVEADPHGEYGRREVQRQRAANVAERQRAYRDLSEE